MKITGVRLDMLENSDVPARDLRLAQMPNLLRIQYTHMAAPGSNPAPTRAARPTSLSCGKCAKRSVPTTRCSTTPSAPTRCARLSKSAMSWRNWTLSGWKSRSTSKKMNLYPTPPAGAQSGGRRGIADDAGGHTASSPLAVDAGIHMDRNAYGVTTARAAFGRWSPTPAAY